jgi:DNA-binding NtrC family response regulator
MLRSKHGIHFQEFEGPVEAVRHLESLKTLTLLLLQEIETLVDTLPSRGAVEKTTAHLPGNGTGEELRIGPINLTDQVQRFEIALICDALLECQGNKTLAAKKLRMNNSTLHAKIQRYKIRFEHSPLGGRAFADEDQSST